ASWPSSWLRLGALRVQPSVSSGASARSRTSPRSFAPARRPETSSFASMSGDKERTVMSTGTAEGRAGLLGGRNVLVTGGSSGIGRGIAAVCAREGAQVAFTYATNAEGAEATLAIVRQHGTGLAISADLRDRAAPARVVAQVEEAWGGIDVLVNNAAVSEVVPFPLLEDADWDELMELNVNAVFRLSRAAARGMLRRKYGRIVNIESIAGARAIASPVHYATSKGALEG